MAYRSDIDDTLLVKQYKSEVLMTHLETQFDACARTLRAHLRAKGVIPNRKISTPWCGFEELQLYLAKKLGLTGAELQAAVPTRSLYAIKGHAIIMAGQGIDLSIDMEQI